MPRWSLHSRRSQDLLTKEIQANDEEAETLDSEPEDSTPMSPANPLGPIRTALAKVRLQNLTKRPHVPPISIRSFYNRLQTSDVVVVDCRGDEEYAGAHLPRSLHCPPPPVLTSLRRPRTVDDIIATTGSEALRRRFQQRDLLEVVVIGSNWSSCPLLYRMDFGYKFARMLLEESRVFAVKFLAQGFHKFRHKYAFLSTSLPLENVQKESRLLARRNSVAQPLPNEIIENFLYLGNFWQANNRQTIQDLGITHIINVGATGPDFDADRIHVDGVQYLDIHVADKEHADLSSTIAQDVIQYILGVQNDKKRNGKVLVHCVQGVSRSATLVIWFVMTQMQCSLLAAYHHVHRARPLIFPNRGFLQQLLKEEKELYGETSINEDELDMLQNGLLEPTDRNGSTLRSSME